MLTNLVVEKAKGKEKDYKLSDSNGLHLLVKTNGSKYWRWSYRFSGKQKTMALGVYPNVSLKDARNAVNSFREELNNGVDPSISLKVSRATEATTLLFKDVVLTYFEEWKTEYKPKTIKRDSGLIQNWVIPFLGDLPANQVEATEILSLIRKLEAVNKRNTAEKVYTLLKRVFAYAIAEPSIPITRNWVYDISELRKPVKANHYAAMIHPKQIGELLKNISFCNAHWLTKLAMELSLHWFIRPAELRKLKWEYVDLESGLVKIPKDEMKTTNTVIDLWIPLSKQTKETLEFIKVNGHPSEYVFFGQKDWRKPISENTVNGALKNMGYKGIQTAHGLRATARTLLEEELKENPLFVEHQLGHVVRDANGRAYNRTTMLEDRKQMLQRWSDYLDNLKYKATHGIEILSRYEQAKSADDVLE